MILDVKKNIFFGILLSLITFLFIFIPGFKVSATQTVDGQFIYGDSYQYVSATDYDFSNFNFTYNNITYTKDYLYEIIENYLNDNNYTIDDFTYIFISTPKNVIISDNTMNSIQIELFSNEIAPASNICFHFRGYDFEGEFIRSASSSSGAEFINTSKSVHLKINLSDNSVSSMTVKYPEYLPHSSWAVRSMYSNKSYNIYSNYFSNNFLVSKQYDFKIYSTFYYDENLLSSPVINYDYQYDKKRGPLDKLYSIDYIFDSNTFNSDIAIQYEINYIDEYEKYSDENISSYLYLNGFKFYGLVNDDGLYHWEELDNTSNSYVDDYEDYYQDGKYYFNVKKMNLDFTNYEKIIFRSIFFNDNYLESAVTRSNNEKISRDDVFYNTVFGPTYLNMQFDTKEFFYLNITSTLSEYKSRWYTWDYSDSDPYKQPYLNYFDLTTSQFVSESHGLPLYYANDLNYDFIEKHDVVIGTSTNKGVVITEEFKKRSVAGLVFTYREQFTYNVIFEFKDLYFSYNNTNDNEKKIYIDKDGNRYQDDGVKASNTNVEQFEGTNALENITDFLNDLRLTSDYFNYNFELNWNKLPGNIQGLILFVFNMSCILVILRIGGYK